MRIIIEFLSESWWVGIGVIATVFFTIYGRNKGFFSKKKPRLITFDANEGTFDNRTTTSMQKFSKNEATNGKALYGGTPNRNGYKFVCWNEFPDGSGKKFYNGKSITLAKNETFYAEWVPEYTLTFDANGGTFDNNNDTTPTQKFVYGERKPLNGGIPIRSGYTFLGWAYTPTANTIDLEEGKSTNWEKGGNLKVTLYAVWK